MNTKIPNEYPRKSILKELATLFNRSALASWICCIFLFRYIFLTLQNARLPLDEFLCFKYTYWLIRNPPASNLLKYFENNFGKNVILRKGQLFQARPMILSFVYVSSFIAFWDKTPLHRFNTYGITRYAYSCTYQQDFLLTQFSKRVFPPIMARGSSNILWRCTQISVVVSVRFNILEQVENSVLWQ